MEHKKLRRTNVAAVIRAELGYQNKSKKALATATGISVDTLRRRLNGVKPFYYEELDAISAFLEVPLADLLQKARTR